MKKKPQTHYSKGDKIIVKFQDGTSFTGVVDSQKGSKLKVRWDHLGYRPQDEIHEVDYRDVGPCSS
jgi:hypothetical protein